MISGQFADMGIRRAKSELTQAKNSSTGEDETVDHLIKAVEALIEAVDH